MIVKYRELRGYSVPQLAKKMGINKQTIYAWEKGEYGVSEDNLDKLSNALGVKFTPLGVIDSEPVKQESQPMIPFFDTVAVGGHSLLADQSPIDQPSEMINPGTFLKSATGALRVYGHSMFPKYPSGCIIAFRNNEDDVIHYGEDYVIELNDRRIVKRVQKSKEPGHIQVSSYNTMKDDTGSVVYSSYDIPMKAVKRMYTVIGKLEIEASI